MKNLRLQKLADTHPDFDMLQRHYSRCNDWEEVKAEYPFGVGQVSIIVKDSKDFHRGSVWFIKPKVEGVREVFDRMQFEGSVGIMNSLSKSMLVEEYEKLKNIE